MAQCVFLILKGFNPQTLCFPWKCLCDFKLRLNWTSVDTLGLVCKLKPFSKTVNTYRTSL